MVLFMNRSGDQKHTLFGIFSVGFPFCQLSVWVGNQNTKKKSVVHAGRVGQLITVSPSEAKIIAQMSKKMWWFSFQIIRFWPRKWLILPDFALSVSLQTFKFEFSWFFVYLFVSLVTLYMYHVFRQVLYMIIFVSPVLDLPSLGPWPRLKFRAPMSNRSA